MSDSARFALHRPEILCALRRGEEKIVRLMAASARRVAAGTILIRADTEHHFTYRLRSGWAARVRTLPDGRSQFVLIFLPGDLFAVKSMFVTRHSDDVVVLSDAVLEHIGQRDLRLAYDEDQDISTRCSWQLVEEERRLHNWVVGLGQGSANERMALLLIDFRGRLILSRSIAPEALSFDMPLSQERLGDHLGISAIHTNRVLKELREKGIVTVRGRKVTIKDYPALCAIAYPLLDTFERNAPEMTGEPAGLPPGERHDGHS